MGVLERYGRKDLNDKEMRWFYFFKTFIENQRIFFIIRKDLGVGGWCLKNPYGVRILNPLDIIGRFLRDLTFIIRIGRLIGLIPLNGLIRLIDLCKGEVPIFRGGGSIKYFFPQKHAGPP